MKGKGIHHSGHVEHEHKGHVMHHHGKKRGGKVEEGIEDKDMSPREVYEGAGSNVVKEAEKRKKGGMCKKHGGKVDGEKAVRRLDRAPRKSGGRVGAEMRPLSEANKMSNRPGADMERMD